MNTEEVIHRLSANYHVFSSLLKAADPGMVTWRPQENQWCLLEVVCHLTDEEVHDFRARCHSILSNPENKLPPIDPTGWVISKDYLSQNYDEKLTEFLSERQQSINWLVNLKNPSWSNTYQHPKIGPMTARMMLHNWLMHDYLHIRQIHRIQTEYFRRESGENLAYAGNW